MQQPKFSSILTKRIISTHHVSSLRYSCTSSSLPSWEDLHLLARPCRSLRNVLVMPVIVERYVYISFRLSYLICALTSLIFVAAGPLQRPSSVCKLQPGRAVLYIRCHPPEKRAQRQQGKGHFGAARDSEASGPRSAEAGGQVELRKSSVVSPVREELWPSVSRIDRRLHGILFYSDVSHNAYSLQRADAASRRRHGPFCGSLLPHLCILCLYAHPARNRSKRWPHAGRIRLLDHQSQNWEYSNGGFSACPQRLRVHREPISQYNHYLFFPIWLLFWSQ